MMPINRPVRVVTRDGKVINGRRLNEDTYTVQLIDDQERLVSLIKADLREYTILDDVADAVVQGHADRRRARRRRRLPAFAERTLIMTRRTTGAASLALLLRAVRLTAARCRRRSAPIAW